MYCGTKPFLPFRFVCIFHIFVIYYFIFVYLVFILFLLNTVIREYRRNFVIVRSACVFADDVRI